MSPTPTPTPTPASDALTLPGPQAHQRAPEPHASDLLTQALCRDAAPVPPPLGQRLRQRVAAHVAANATLTTRRQPLQANAEDWAHGVRAWPLSIGRSWWVVLPAHAPLPQGEGAHELLVLAGSLHLGTQVLTTQGHALTAGVSPWQAGPEGAQLYLRRHDGGHASGPFNTPASPLLQAPDPTAWQPLRPGVAIRPLHGEGPAMSLLARFDAGARVPAHAHGIDEECLMVEGELFLGDLLLRQGGFQAAPAGSQHGDLVADGPCLLFFHGAVDAAAVDNDHRQAQGWPAL